MSSAARRRVAMANQPVALSSPAPANRMMTLQEIIALTDARLTALERQPPPSSSSPSPPNTPDDADNLSNLVADLLHPHLEEFNHRYEILATEIHALKDVVLKLQSYTLDVNKMLMEERIRVLAAPREPSIFIHDDEEYRSEFLSKGEDDVVKSELEEITTTGTLPEETMTTPEDTTDDETTTLIENETETPTSTPTPTPAPKAPRGRRKPAAANAKNAISI